MYKNIALLVFFVFCFSSFSVSYAKKKDDEKAAYERAQREASEAFQELDKEKLDIFNDPKTEAKGTNDAYDSFKMNEEAVDTSEKAVEDKPNPHKTEEKKRPVLCDIDYEMIDGLPSWIINPSMDGYPVSAIGLGIYGAGGLAGQKRAARIQAQGEIAKMLNVQIDNELNIEKTSHKSAIEDKSNTNMESYSRQRSASVLDNIEELKCWVDPSNNDYYILLGISSDRL